MLTLVAAPPYALAIAAGVALLALELFSGAFVFLGLGLGLFAVALVEVATGRFAPVRDAFVLAFCASVLIWTLRYVFKARGDTRRAEGDVNEY